MATAAGIIIGIPLLLYSYIFFSQDNLVFQGAKTEPGIESYIKTSYPLAEEITISTPDGCTLSGYFVNQTSNAKTPLMIFFGGNAEDSTWFAAEAEKYKGWNIVTLNYRGYGKSTCKSTEETTYADALLIYDTTSVRNDVDKNKIVSVGRSLGTGVAVYLSANRPVSGTILVSPYDSMVEVSKFHFPWVPVSVLLKHRFEAIKLAPSIKTPMIALIASNDDVVPNERSLKLINAWGGEKSAYRIEGTRHNTIDSNPAFYEVTNEFLKMIN